MNITIKVDSRALQAAFNKAPQKVVNGLGEWVNRTAARTQRHARSEVPVRQGTLQNSIHIINSGRLSAVVKPTADYALYVHEGTGVYGPKKRRIVAKGRALAFQVDGQIVFRKSVKGQKPNKFMKRTYEAVQPWAQRDANTILGNIVRSI